MVSRAHQPHGANATGGLSLIRSEAQMTRLARPRQRQHPLLHRRLGRRLGLPPSHRLRPLRHPLRRPLRPLQPLRRQLLRLPDRPLQKPSTWV